MRPDIHSFKDLCIFIRDNKYTWWLLYIPAYLIYFAVLENITVPDEAVRIIETPLDRMIPTIPWFFYFLCNLVGAVSGGDLIFFNQGDEGGLSETLLHSVRGIYGLSFRLHGSTKRT